MNPSRSGIIKHNDQPPARVVPCIQTPFLSNASDNHQQKQHSLFPRLMDILVTLVWWRPRAISTVQLMKDKIPRERFWKMGLGDGLGPC